MLNVLIFFLQRLLKYYLNNPRNNLLKKYFNFFLKKVLTNPNNYAIIQSS